MACGSGKTFTAFSIIKAITQPGALILFLVPSLDLMRQTISFSRRDADFDFDGFAVCSDQTTAYKSQQDNIFVSDAEIPISDVIRSPADIKNHYDHLKKISKTNRNIIFSTYQSLDKIIATQRFFNLPCIDLIVCDEAHRTAKIKDKAVKKKDNFSSVHDNNKLQANKRLYMTATPKVFTKSKWVKQKHDYENVELWSMDDDPNGIFGKHFFTFSFSEGVAKKCLSDFRVIVLGLCETEYTAEYQKYKESVQHDYDAYKESVENKNELQTARPANKKVDLMIELSDYTRLMGVFKILAEENINSAIAFCRFATKKAGNSLLLANFFEDYKKRFLLKKETKIIHIDGTMSTAQRRSKINELENHAPGECVVLSNARCLTEGVDVPALDAVIFMHGRKSKIDIVQATGRVMRQQKDKKYGVVILPIVGRLNEKQLTNEITKRLITVNSDEFKKIEDVLNALRSPQVKPLIGKNANNVRELDDEWNKNLIEVVVRINVKKIKKLLLQQNAHTPSKKEDVKKQEIEYSNILEKQINKAILTSEKYIKSGVLKRIGSRSYWSIWMGDYLVKTASRTKDHIYNLLNKEENQELFNKFSKKLKTYLNPNISKEDVINLLRDSFVTEPIFNILFPNSLINNPVAKTITDFIQSLKLDNAMDVEKEALKSFYNEIELEVKTINEEKAKQNLLKKIYGEYINLIYPGKAKELGIVYTPVEVIDFLLKSVSYLLKTEFNNSSFNDKEVKILDPFTGVGTFISRLLSEDLNLINGEHLLYKYNNDIYANEILLLPYYIASTNIQHVFNTRFKTEYSQYLPFPGIIWTDTFQLYEKQFETQMQMKLSKDDNNERISKQEKEAINVIIGNPPYSIKKNNKYKKLDSDIHKLASLSKAKGKNKLFDSYIKSFFFSVHQIKKNNKKGIIAFITNNGYLNNISSDSFRKYFLEKEFYKIFIIDLKGDIRSDIRLHEKKEGESIFKNTMIGSCLFIGILNEQAHSEIKGKVFYIKVGNNWKSEKKLEWLSRKKSIEILWKNNEFTKIYSDKNGDWFDKKVLWPKSYIKLRKGIFNLWSNGVKFHKLRFATNFSEIKIKPAMEKEIDKYNSYFVNKNIKFSSKELNEKIEANIVSPSFDENYLRFIQTRPFVKKWCYYDEHWILSHYQMKKICPITGSSENIMINFYINPLAVKTLTTYSFIEGVQNYPFYLYDSKSQDLLKKTETTKTNINNLAHKYFHYKKNNDAMINNDLILDYTYGFLHYKEYQTKFKNNFIARDSPYICKPKSYNCFLKISKIGKQLKELHLNYENCCYKGKNVPYNAEFEKGNWDLEDSDYKVRKMSWAKDQQGNVDKSKIIFNEFIAIKNIPLQAYQYKVGFKSAIKHVMDGYKVEEKKNSDPNDFAIETMHDPKYILKLLIRIINLSLITLDLVKQLPDFNKIEWDQTVFNQDIN